MDEKTLQRLELDKILNRAAEYCSTSRGKQLLAGCRPSASLSEVRTLLDCTEECDRLLYTHGIGKVEFFGDTEDILSRASKGVTLSCGELLEVNALLRSARTAYDGISSINDESIEIMRVLADRLYFDRALEEDVSERIISSNAVSDRASARLYEIRSLIKSLNERIRSKLGECLSRDARYLQDAIVTVRNDRYVIPVRAEYKNRIRGFVHDRSQSGATFFIEPEYVLELNNELVALTIDEKEEIEAILRALSARFGAMSEKLLADIEVLAEIDADLARAEYAYTCRSVKPKVNDRGFIEIIKGRHPLIEREKVVPVTLSLGGEYDFLLLSGANTGGKTVTLKMCGLFCLMAACGLFIPAADGSSVGVFREVFCDIGDSQSIEESLSTFSSHLNNVIDICNNVTGDSLVLIDEPGGGTNPDEGQALAKAIVKFLLERGCKGIVTTHYTSLKEFAYSAPRIENASMEFDADTLKPLYSIKTGLAGASNALAVSRKLGLREEILEDAVSFLSDGAKSFENVLRRAEESRLKAEESFAEAESLKEEWRRKSDEVNALSKALAAEREKLNRSVRGEIRRIVTERTLQAEQIIAEMEKLFRKEEPTHGDLIRARTLKNEMERQGVEEEQPDVRPDYIQADPHKLAAGTEVYVKKADMRGRVISVSPSKGEAEVECNGMRLRCRTGELFLYGGRSGVSAGNVRIVRNIPLSQPKLELNVMGMTADEALYEVENFLDKAVTDNLEEVKIIHGTGTGKLRKAISERLARHRNVESFRLGRYGEGETGVTIVKLK